MSLPACQERVLKDIEGTLRAGEPHLAAMFAIFARLHRDEPVRAEPLGRRRPRLPRARVALAAVVLPVVLVLAVLAMLLGSAARGAASVCAARVSAPAFTSPDSGEQRLPPPSHAVAVGSPRPC